MNLKYTKASIIKIINITTIMAIIPTIPKLSANPRLLTLVLAKSVLIVVIIPLPRIINHFFNIQLSIN